MPDTSMSCVDRFAQPDAETALLQLLADGASNKEIGEAFGYSVDAIKKLMGVVTTRWDASDRTNLVHLACTSDRLVVGRRRVKLGLVTAAEYERRRCHLACSLTPPQPAMLRLVAEGLTNEAIALKVGLSVPAVQWRLTDAMNRWEARNRTHWVYIAHCYELPLPEDLALSEAELAVVRLVAKGMTNDAIARYLFLSPHTIKKQLTRASKKLGFSDRRHVAAIVRVLGLTGGDTDD